MRNITQILISCMRRLIYIVLCPLLLFACRKDEPVSEQPDNSDIRHTVLIYAVNRSSLGSDFNDDLTEMIEAMSHIDLSKYQLLLFKTDSESKCGLYSFVKEKNASSARLNLIRQYNRDKTSTHPERIKEVIDYSLSIFPNSTYDLIFWGHGMSWKPYFTDHVVDYPSNYSYGGEYTGGSNNGKLETDWTEINELADCVPDHVFDTIWFDCCYMTGIEVIYEFKDKCNTFVGYPSEVWSYGLAYDLILPYLFRPEHDMVAAAKAFFDFYDVTADPVTVAVVNMLELEGVADISRMILKSGDSRPDASILMNYSRTASSPFYDFRQFMREIAVLNNRPDLSGQFDDAFNRMTIYHAESKMNFSHRPWDYENISGISTHFYRGNISVDEQFYESLKWFNRVYN